MPGIPIGGLGSPACYLITRGYGFVEKTATGWADDHLRDPLLVATPGADGQAGFNQWHPRQAAADQARLQGLYRLEATRWGAAGWYSVRAPLGDMANRNVDLTFRIAGINHAVSFEFVPGGNMPPNPDNWTPEDVRSCVDAEALAAIGFGGPYAELEDPAGGTGRLTILGGSAAAGDGVKVEDTSDPWVLSILGYHAGRIAFAPQPNDGNFDGGGVVAAGLELHSRGDGVYRQVNNRPLLNVAADLRTLRREFLLLRDGVDERWPSGQVQAAMSGQKVLDGTLMFPQPSASSPFPNAIAWEGNGLPGSMGGAEMYYAKFPELSDPWNSPMRMAFYDDGGSSGLVDILRFEDNVGDGPPSNWSWGVMFSNAHVPFGGAGISLSGGAFSLGTVTTSAPYAPGAALDVLVPTAIVHSGDEFGVYVYHQPSATMVQAIHHAGNLETTQVYDDVFTNAIIGPVTTMHRGYAAYVMAAGDEPGGGAPGVSMIYYRPDMSGAAVPMPMPFGAPSFGYGFMFLGGTGSAFDHTDTHATTWLATTAGARMESHEGNRDYHQFSVRDLAGTAGFDTFITARNASGFVQESAPGAPNVPIFAISTQDNDVGGPLLDIQRVEVEGRFSADTPYALRLMHDATESVQTELVFEYHGSSRRILQWQEGTPWSVWVDVRWPHALPRVDRLTFAIPSWNPVNGVTSAMVVATSGSVDVLTAVEFPQTGYLPLSGYAQIVSVGDVNYDPKVVAFENPNVYAWSIGWDAQTRRRLAYASAADPARAVGSLFVHRGGTAYRNLDGEVADLYRVFCPDDYWWDVSDAITRTYGTITLSAAIAPVPSWSAPVKLYHIDAVERTERLCCVLVERDPTTPPGTFRYRYVMEGFRPAVGATVCEESTPGAPLSVLAVSYQPRGTIILKAGRYVARHRLYFSAPHVGVFQIGDCVEQVTGPAAIGAVVEADAAGNWIDVAASVGRWEEGRNVDLVVSPAGPFAVKYVVYPIDFSKPSRLITGETNWAHWKHCRIGSEIRVVGEGGAEIVGYGGVVRLRNDTDSSGFDPGLDEMVGDSADANWPARNAYGDYMGLTFEGISFGGVVMKDYAGGARNVLSGYNDHGVVVSDAYPASFHDSYWYGIRFDRCVFHDRIVWIHDDSSWLLLNPPDRRSVGVEARNCFVDVSYMFGVDEYGGVLADYPHALMDDACLWDSYAHNSAVRKYGPALDGCVFENVRISSNRMPKAGYKYVLPFVVPSMSDVRISCVLEGIDTKNLAPGTPGWYFEDRAAYARCDYALNVNVDGCAFRETPLWLGATYATIVYDANITGSVSVGDLLVTAGCAVGEILGFETTANPGDTAVCRLVRSWMYDPLPSETDNVGVLAWIDPAQPDREVNFNLGIALLGLTYRVASASKGSAGVRVASTVLGAVRVHGAYDYEDSYILNADIADGNLNRRVVVDGCSFSHGYRATGATSPLASWGAAADFVLCGNVRFSGNRIGVTFRDYELVGGLPYDDASPAFASLVSASGCRRVVSDGNAFLAISAPGIDGNAQVISKHGCDLTIYSAYACDDVGLFRDEVRDVDGGDAYCHNNYADPAGGGGVSYLTSVNCRAYRVVGTKIRGVATGSAAGASTSVYDRGGDFSVIRDLPAPGDHVDEPSYPPVDYYSHFDRTPETPMEADLEAANVTDVACADGESFAVALAKNIDPGRGGDFHGWHGLSWSHPSSAYDRTWGAVSMVGCKFRGCSAGGGGSCSVGDHNGGTGGGFYGLRAYLGNATVLNGPRVDLCEFTACLAGDGGDGHGTGYGGGGGTFRGAKVSGPYKFSGLSKRVISGIAVDRGRFVECFGGSGGTGASPGGPGEFVGLDVATGADASVMTATYREISASRNEFTNCSPGTGDCGFFHSTWPGTVLTGYDRGAGGPVMPVCGVSWSALRINISSIDAIDANGNGFVNGVVVHGNTFVYDRRNGTFKAPDESCMSAMHVAADLAYGLGGRPLLVVWPMRGVRISGNTRVFSDPDNLNISSAVLLVTNSAYSPAGLPDQAALSDRYGVDFLVEGNAWGVEPLDPVLAANNRRHTRDHIVIPMWNQIPPARIWLQLYADETGADNKWGDFVTAVNANNGFTIGMSTPDARVFVTDDCGQAYCIKDGNSELGAAGVLDIQSRLMANLGGAGGNAAQIGNAVCGILKLAGVDASHVVVNANVMNSGRLLIQLDKCHWGKVSYLLDTASIPGVGARYYQIPLQVVSVGGGVTLPFEVVVGEEGVMASRREVSLDAFIGPSNVSMVSFFAVTGAGLATNVPYRGIVIKGNT